VSQCWVKEARYIRMHTADSVYLPYTGEKVREWPYLGGWIVAERKHKVGVWGAGQVLCTGCISVLLVKFAVCTLVTCVCTFCTQHTSIKHLEFRVFCTFYLYIAISYRMFKNVFPSYLGVYGKQNLSFQYVFFIFNWIRCGVHNTAAIGY
jgi:hypothetical protein